MAVDTGRSPAETLDDAAEGDGGGRLDEDRARKILERAAALDAERSSEIDVAQLREAAAAAGISREAFEQALREDHQAESPAPRKGAREAAVVSTAPSASQVSHYAGVLRDLLGDDATVQVVEDRIEARDKDGVTVSVSPTSGEATAAIVSEASLKSRLFAIALPFLIPFVFAIILAFEEEEAAIGILIGALMAVVGASVATVVASRRERKRLRKKAERLRRQLQRMLGPGSDQA